MDYTSKLVGESGTQFIDSAAGATAGTFYQLYVQEDTVISALSEADYDGTGSASVLADQNLSGKTLKAGVILTPRKDHFDSVTVSSGAVIAYKSR